MIIFISHGGEDSFFSLKTRSSDKGFGCAIRTCHFWQAEAGEESGAPVVTFPETETLASKLARGGNNGLHLRCEVVRDDSLRSSNNPRQKALSHPPASSAFSDSARVQSPTPTRKF